MPLIEGKSDKARSANIAELIRSGRDPKQAAAIAYSVQAKARHAHMADGGVLEEAERLLSENGNADEISDPIAEAEQLLAARQAAGGVDYDPVAEAEKFLAQTHGADEIADPISEAEEVLAARQASGGVNYRMLADGGDTDSQDSQEAASNGASVVEGPEADAAPTAPESRNRPFGASDILSDPNEFAAFQQRFKLDPTAARYALMHPDEASNPMMITEFAATPQAAAEGAEQPSDGSPDNHAAAQSPQQAPPAQVQSQAAHGSPVDPYGRAIAAATGMQVRGTNAEAAAEADKAQQDAALAGEQQKYLADQEQQQQQMRQQAMADGQKRMGQYEAANAKVNSTQIDPNHAWNSRSVGGKALGILGILVSGFSGSDKNTALEELSKETDRDIDAQKANMANARAGAEGFRNLYDMNRSIFQDDQAARLATQKTRMDQYLARANQISAQAAGPTAKAKALEGVGLIQQRALDLKTQLAQRVQQVQMGNVDMQLKQRELEQSQNLMNLLQGDVQGANATPHHFSPATRAMVRKSTGMDQPQGLNVDPMTGAELRPGQPGYVAPQWMSGADADAVTSATQKFQNTDRILGEIQAIRSRHVGGSPLPRSTDAGLLDSLQTQLATAVSRGELSNRNIDIWNSMSGDITAGNYTSHRIDAGIANLRSNLKAERSDMLRAHGLL